MDEPQAKQRQCLILAATDLVLPYLDLVQLLTLRQVGKDTRRQAESWILRLKEEYSAAIKRKVNSICNDWAVRTVVQYLLQFPGTDAAREALRIQVDVTLPSLHLSLETPTNPARWPGEGQAARRLPRYILAQGTWVVSLARDGNAVERSGCAPTSSTFGTLAAAVSSHVSKALQYQSPSKAALNLFAVTDVPLHVAHPSLARVAVSATAAWSRGFTAGQSSRQNSLVLHGHRVVIDPAWQYALLRYVSRVHVHNLLCSLQPAVPRFPHTLTRLVLLRCAMQHKTVDCIASLHRLSHLAIHQCYTAQPGMAFRTPLRASPVLVGLLCNAVMCLRHLEHLTLDLGNAAFVSQLVLHQQARIPRLAHVQLAHVPLSSASWLAMCHLYPSVHCGDCPLELTSTSWGVTPDGTPDGTSDGTQPQQNRSLGAKGQTPHPEPQILNPPLKSQSPALSTELRGQEHQGGSGQYGINSIVLGWQTPQRWLQHAALLGQLDSLTSLHVGLGARVRDSDLLALASRQPPLVRIKLVSCSVAAPTVLKLAAACRIRHLGVVHPTRAFWLPRQGISPDHCTLRQLGIQTTCSGCHWYSVEPPRAPLTECRAANSELHTTREQVQNSKNSRCSYPRWAQLESLHLRGRHVAISARQLRGLLPSRNTWLSTVRIAWVGGMGLGEAADALTWHAPGLRTVELAGLRVCGAGGGSLDRKGCVGRGQEVGRKKEQEGAPGCVVGESGRAIDCSWPQHPAPEQSAGSQGSSSVKPLRGWARRYSRTPQACFKLNAESGEALTSNKLSAVDAMGGERKSESSVVDWQHTTVSHSTPIEWILGIDKRTQEAPLAQFSLGRHEDDARSGEQHVQSSGRKVDVLCADDRCVDDCDVDDHNLHGHGIDDSRVQDCIVYDNVCHHNAENRSLDDRSGDGNNVIECMTLSKSSQDDLYPSKGPLPSNIAPYTSSNNDLKQCFQLIDQPCEAPLVAECIPCPYQQCCITKLLNLVACARRLLDLDISSLAVKVPIHMLTTWVRQGTAHIRMSVGQVRGLRDSQEWVRLMGKGAEGERVWRWDGQEGASAWLVEVD